jgi:hypothetical protein
MAIRQCYIASKTHVDTNDIEFKFFSGFALSQKQKCINSLHDVIVDTKDVKRGELLEISSKSEFPLGVALSAFNLSAETLKYNTKYTVESAFQSSKVFQGNIQYKDIISFDSKSAKKDPRIRNSGNLSHFQFFGHRFEISNGTAFYDWLYINVLLQNPDLCEEIMKYRAFTDIEFNSQKSMNTQAFAIALYVSLKLADIDMSVLKDPESFIEVTFPFYNKFI